MNVADERGLWTRAARVCPSPRSPRASQRRWNRCGYRITPRDGRRTLSGEPSAQRVALARAWSSDPELLLLGRAAGCARPQAARRHALRAGAACRRSLRPHLRHGDPRPGKRRGPWRGGWLSWISAGSSRSARPHEVYERPRSRFVADFTRHRQYPAAGRYGRRWLGAGGRRRSLSASRGPDTAHNRRRQDRRRGLRGRSLALSRRDR